MTKASKKTGSKVAVPNATAPAAEPAVLISLSQSTGYERSVLLGVCAYLVSRPPWSLYAINPGDDLPDEFRKIPFAGAIGRFAGATTKAIDALGIPKVVTTTDHYNDPSIARVMPDDDMIGRTGATHLLERGFRRFAFIGMDFAWSLHRMEGFRAQLAEAGYEPACYIGAGTESSPWTPQPLDDRLVHWLETLEKPTGLMVSRDFVGVRVSEICRHRGIQVPDELAIVSVDNDEVLCRYCRPMLTSIATPAEQVGFQAAALLDTLMHGTPPERKLVILPHRGVVQRASTDVVSVGDAAVAAAARFIRENVDKPIQVEDVCAATKSPRRTLERRYRLAVGRTLHDDIRRGHVERAKELLLHSDSPLRNVAQRSGFASTERFHVVFRDVTGQTPQEFRSRGSVSGGTDPDSNGVNGDAAPVERKRRGRKRKNAV